jgi:hypothetical protein
VGERERERERERENRRGRESWSNEEGGEEKRGEWREKEVERPVPLGEDGAQEAPAALLLHAEVR